MTPLAELRALWEKADRNEWFVEHGATKSGLSRIDTGLTAHDAMYPITCEAHEAALIAAAHNRMGDLLAVAEAAEGFSNNHGSLIWLEILDKAVKALQSPGRETGDGT